jgi:hypothetical protein
MKDKKNGKIGRRDFLRAAGAGAGLVAAGGGPLVTTASADSENDTEKRKARYKETEDVKAFYRTNRYPS